MRDIQHMEYESIGKLIWKFSVPAIVGMIANASYNVVDRIFVGRGVGTEAISGITLTFPIVTIILAFCMLIGIGSTALISIKLGEKDKNTAEHILGNAVFLSIFISLITATPLLIFLKDLLYFFGARGDVFDYARDYFQIILYGNIFQITSFSLNAIIRGEGNPRIAMSTMLIGAISNIVLDAIFIFNFGWGIKGAAWATVLSQVISTMWVLYYFLGRKSLLNIKVINLVPQIKIIKGIFSIGISPFLMHAASSGIFLLLNTQFLQYGGEVAVAAMGIVNSMVMFFFMPIFGLNQGIQPIIGYNYGAKQYRRVRAALRKGMLYATMICVAGWIAIHLFPEAFISLFSEDDTRLIAVGSHGLVIFSAMIPIVGFQIILSAYFQAIGRSVKSVILTLTRQIVFILPLMFILPLHFGLDGLWAFTPVSDLLAFFIASTFFLIERRRLKKLISEQAASKA